MGEVGDGIFDSVLDGCDMRGEVGGDHRCVMCL